MPSTDPIRGGYTRQRALSNWRLRTQQAGDDPALLVGNDGTMLGIDPTPAVAEAVAEVAATVLLAGLSGPAAVPVGRHQLVTLSADGVRLFEPTATTGDRTVAPVAMALDTFAVGQQVRTIAAGTVDDASWALVAEQPVFAAPGGGITQTAPTTGAVRVVGWAVTPTRIYITNRQGFNQ